ncbi:hypothetical protein H0E87_022542 [Populus deltoides]|uniref:Uncharacterized protein n=1 Tax=Populus deltoides TaxID=3696 RepID=A0A8T2X8Y1_POPDE|nr:hypothetical protein H0E87_022542 [Populus deltoides]
MKKDNDKENVDPIQHGLADLSLPLKGDHMKAFINEEAEVEDGVGHCLHMKSSHQDGASLKVLAPNVRTESHTSPNFTKRMENLEAANVSGDLAKVFLVGSLDAEKSLVVARTGGIYGVDAF